MLSANAKLHFLSFQNSAMLKVFPFPLLLIIRTLTHALLKTAGNHMGKMERQLLWIVLPLVIMFNWMVFFAFSWCYSIA